MVVPSPRTVRLVPKEFAVPHLAFGVVVDRLHDRLHRHMTAGLLRVRHRVLSTRAYVPSSAIAVRKGDVSVSGSNQDERCIGILSLKNKMRTKVKGGPSPPSKPGPSLGGQPTRGFGIVAGTQILTRLPKSQRVLVHN